MGNSRNERGMNLGFGTAIAATESSSHGVTCQSLHGGNDSKLSEKGGDLNSYSQL